MTATVVEQPTGDVLPAGEVAGRVARIVDEVSSLETGVAALEDLRRLEAWLVWAKHRLAAQTARLAAEEQARWVELHPIGFDDEVDALPGGRGLSRVERLGVGERAGVAEVACALRTSEVEVHGLLRRAERLTDLLPATSAALAQGAVTASAADTILDATAEYADALTTTGVDRPDADAWAVAIANTERCLLEAAVRGRAPAQLRRRARQLRDRLHPRSFREREGTARSDRYVRISPDRDGMARLSALLPAAVAWRIDGRLSSLARALQESVPSVDKVDDAAAVMAGTAVDEGPTIGQLRADVLADLLTGIAAHPCTALDCDGAGGTAAGTGGTGGSAGTGGVGRVARGDGALDGGRAPDGDRAAVLSATGGGVPRYSGDEGPMPRVLLTVPAATLLGGDEPGELGDFGLIPAADARALAVRAGSFLLGVTAGTAAGGTGCPCQGDGSGVDVGQVVPVLVTTGRLYRIPAAVRRALQVRDGTCRFPGCRRNAAGCDLDHVTAWADGGTSEPSNLAHLCRKHHVLKHHAGWTVTSDPPPIPPPATPPPATPPPATSTRSDEVDDDGRAVRRRDQVTRVPAHGTTSVLTWTSPTGRRYVTEPDDPPPF
ncbi:hypothetical protein BGP79_12720 [Tersicoccus sp. Bi-70]|nr:hypothetical protein BGP79_12720 [Tersicoccus sp. Bi-70]